MWVCPPRQGLPDVGITLFSPLFSPVICFQMPARDEACVPKQKGFILFTKLPPPRVAAMADLRAGSTQKPLPFSLAPFPSCSERLRVPICLLWSVVLLNFNKNCLGASKSTNTYINNNDKYRGHSSAGKALVEHAQSPGFRLQHCPTWTQERRL